ncbi:MAG: hypothetical protein IRY94_03360 [Rhodospirillaceae bacterium]|nr:hypothetical protein [Rhodospirillaceae bacterium]
MTMCSDGPPAAPRRSLADYVRGLLEGLEAGEPTAIARMRAVVGSRRAAITVDDETVIVAFDGERPRVDPVDTAACPAAAADGIGVTDRQTVLALLDGRLEVTEAIETGAIEIRGATDDVVRMGIAIEILIDGAVRVPALQALADAYRRDPDRDPMRLADGMRTAENVARRRRHERDILARLGLLSNRGGPAGSAP